MTLRTKPKPLQLPLPGGQREATVTVRPMVTGYALLPPSFCLRRPGRFSKLRGYGVGVSRRKWSWLPVPAFLIEHPSAGLILIDTGFHPSVAVDPAKNLGRLITKIQRCKVDLAETVPKRLEAIGLATTDIKTVIMTHLHLDHASCISEFSAADFIIAENEWAAANQPRPLLHGYRPRHFDHAFNYLEVNFSDKAAHSYSSFGRTVDLFGDGSIRLCFTPGHTPGHMSVIARTKEREIMVLGDAAYTRANYLEMALPSYVDDEHRYMVSLREIQLYAKQHPSALVIPSHDAGLWQTLDDLYE